MRRLVVIRNLRSHVLVLLLLLIALVFALTPMAAAKRPAPEAPVVTIVLPSTAERYDTRLSAVTLSGWVRGTWGIVDVSWQSSTGRHGSALGGTLWLAPSVRLSEGENLITVTARDAKGNLGRDSILVVKDTTAPSVSIVPPGGTFGGPQSVTLSASEPAAISYTLDGTAPTTTSAIYAGPFTLEQTATVKCFARDAAGNTSGVASAEFVIRDDTTAPIVTLTSPVDGALLSDATPLLEYAVDDPTATVVVKVDGSAVDTRAGEELDALADGEHTVAVEAKDPSDNSGSAAASFTIDATPPLLSAVPGGGLYRAAQSVQLLASEDAVITYTLDGSVPDSTSTLYTMPIDIPVDTTLKAIAVDAAGNVSNLLREDYTIDTAAPVVRITAPEDASLTSDATPLLDYTVDDPTASVVVTVDGDDVATRAGESLAELADGVHDVSVSATDPAGNEGSDSVSFTIDATAPTLTASPTGGTFEEAQSVRLEASEPATIRYTLDGSTPDNASAAYADPIAIAETTTLKAVATDAAGNRSGVLIEVYTISVDLVPPVVALSSPADGGATNDATPLLSYTVDDPTASVVVTVDDAPVATRDGEYLASLGDGQHSVRVEATDAADNTGSDAASFTVDTVAPVVTADPPGGSYTAAQSVTFSASDPVTIHYTLDGGEPGAGSPLYGLPILVDESLTLRFLAADAAGNTASGTESYVIELVTQPVIQGAAVDKDALTLSYDKALDETSVPAAADFVVEVNGAAQNAPKSVSVADKTVGLVLDQAAAYGDVVTLTYTPGAAPIKDTTGQPAAALVDYPVTNVSAPAGAPAVDPTVPYDIYTATEFLYSGDNPIQTGVADDAIVSERAAVVRGEVTFQDGSPAQGVRVSVVGHPEYGSTTTPADGWFSMAVNNGQLSLNYELAGCPAVTRQETVPAGDYTIYDPVVLVRYDEKATPVDLGATTMQVAQGSEVSDLDGERRSTLLIAPGTTAQLAMPDGSSQPVDHLTIRSTEFSVGESGEDAMPAKLPPQVAYTYCVELSADEAVAASAEVKFDRPLIHYVENFLDFPVGTPAPVGSFNSDLNAWVGEKSGLVVKVLAIENGLAVLDVDGSGNPASVDALAALGVTTDELGNLASLYAAGQSLWRVEIAHFTPYDINWGWAIPPGATPPPTTEKEPPCRPCDRAEGDSASSNVLEQSVTETATVFGLSAPLVTKSQSSGAKQVQITGESVPERVKYIIVTYKCAGVEQTTVIDNPSPMMEMVFGPAETDPFKRYCYGGSREEVKVGYAYEGLYNKTIDWAQNTGIPLTRPLPNVPSQVSRTLAASDGAYAEFIPTRGDVVLWQTVTWRSEDPDLGLLQQQRLGGWALDLLHAYDSRTGRLFSATGTSDALGATGLGQVDTIAGNLTRAANEAFFPGGDAALATAARLESAIGMDFSTDGSFFVAHTFFTTHDYTAGVVRRVDPDGMISTLCRGFSGTPASFASGPDGRLYVGCSVAYSGSWVFVIDPDGTFRLFAGGGTPADGVGDGGPATQARLESAAGLAVAPDGTVYVSDSLTVRKIDVSGVITRFAGGGNPASGLGDGGPALSARLGSPKGLALTPDGSLLIADSSNYRVRKVDPSGMMTTVAGGGTGTADGILATTARIDDPRCVLAAEGGAFLVGTGTMSSTGGRIRRVDSAGLITTIAGGGSPPDGLGDGGPATSAAFSMPRGMTFGPDQALYIVQSSRVRRIGQDGVITTVAGGGTPAPNGDGTTSAMLWATEGVAAGPDGTVYFTDRPEVDSWGARVRAVAPDGMVSTVAGGGNPADGVGDGGPATKAKLTAPYSVAVGPDSCLYILDGYTDFYGTTVGWIRKVKPDGTISTVAGRGTLTGDGIPAMSARLQNPKSLVVGPDSSIYLVDGLEAYGNNDRVRRISPDGIITTVAGGGSDTRWQQYGDHAPIQATQVRLQVMLSVALGPDGSLYLGGGASGPRRVFRIGADGVISLFAGGGAQGVPNRGDGGPAIEASLNDPVAMAVSPEGALYIGESATTGSYDDTIRMIDTSGYIHTVAGGGSSNDAVTGARLARLGDLRGLAYTPEGNLVFSVRTGMGASYDRIRRLTTVVNTPGRGEQVVPASDGSEVYVFDESGRQLKTVDALDGHVLYSFSYRPDGLLASFMDDSGGVATIERDASGNATAVVAPEGQRTELSMDETGRLIGVTCPLGNTATYAYDASGNIVTSTDRMGKVTAYTYRPDGRLVGVHYPGGGWTTIERHFLAGVLTVSRTTATGRVTTYAWQRLADGSLRSTITSKGGATHVKTTAPDATVTEVSSTGMTRVVTYQPDPRWGMLAPIPSKMTYVSPGGVETVRSLSRSVSVSVPGDPLSLIRLTDTYVVDGETSTVTYDRPSGMVTERSAEGRTLTTTWDGRGKLTAFRAGTLDPVTMAYDDQGRLTRITRDGHSSTFSHDEFGQIANMTDAAGHTVAYDYNAAGLLEAFTTPSGATFGFSYDRSGSATAVTAPGEVTHAAEYTDDGLISSYTAPDGTQSSCSYDLDGYLTQWTTPIGLPLLADYDSAGRLVSVGNATASVQRQYVGGTDLVASVVRADASGSQSLAYSYDGHLLTGMHASGAVDQTWSYRWGAGMKLVGVTRGAEAETPLEYDRDNLLVRYGPFAITRDANGFETLRSDGTGASSWTYDGAGRWSQTKESVGGAEAYRCDLTRNEVGQVVRKVEQLGGDQTVHEYAYDVDGRLAEVRTDGAVTETYAYDARGNRLSVQKAGQPAVNAEFDVCDAITSQGPTSYLYDRVGSLVKRGNEAFQRSPFGELLRADLASGVVSYQYDGYGRRVLRHDGSGDYLFEYGYPMIPWRITGTVDSSGVRTDYYYDGAGRLCALERTGMRYYVAADQVGSPRLVVDPAGQIVKRVDYDAWGNVLADSNTEFDLPFGFAGGIVDAATGFVLFGVREYDPETGRFTTRDPAGFGGGQLNVYLYCHADPVNWVDPSGLESTESATPAVSWQRGVVNLATDKAKEMLIDAAWDLLKDAGPVLNKIPYGKSIYDKVELAKNALDAAKLLRPEKAPRLMECKRAISAQRGRFKDLILGPVKKIPIFGPMLGVFAGWIDEYVVEPVMQLGDASREGGSGSEGVRNLMSGGQIEGWQQ